MGASELIIFDADNCYFWGGADGRRDSGHASVNQPLSETTGLLRQACLARH
jgi:hypothetical protein